MADSAVHGDSHRPLPIKPIPVDGSAAVLLVNREEGHAVAGEVVEEMGPERGLDLEICEIGLDDRANRGDLRPGDRNAQPRVPRAPPSRADQDRMPSVASQLTVDLLDDGGRIGGLRTVYAAGIDHHQIGDGLAATVPESDLGSHHHPPDRCVVEIHLHIHLFEDHRPELKNAECLALSQTRFDVGRELDLGRAREPVPAGVEKAGEDLRQGNHPPPEQRVEGDQGRPALLETGDDAVVGSIIGGRERRGGTVANGLDHLLVQEVGVDPNARDHVVA